MPHHTCVACCSIAKKLGSGGFADVFLAAHWHLGTVAFKQIRSGRSGSCQVQREELQREMQVWSELRHPHIVLVMGASDFKDEHFIVTELVHLPSLAWH